VGWRAHAVWRKKSAWPHMDPGLRPECQTVAEDPQADASSFAMAERRGSQEHLWGTHIRMTCAQSVPCVLITPHTLPRCGRSHTPKPPAYAWRGSG